MEIKIELIKVSLAPMDENFIQEIDMLKTDLSVLEDLTLQSDIKNRNG